MRHLVVIAIAVVFLVAMYFLKQHKEKIMICGFVVLSLVSGVYCYTHADSVLAKRQPTNQTFYDTDYIETKEFPDAFFRLFLKGKTIYVKADRMEFKDAEKQGVNWLYSYYHVTNMVDYLESVEANVIEDESMVDSVVTKDIAKNFEELGFLNDLLRNSMMYTKYDEECGNYFYYLWYYRDFAKTSSIYANADSLNEDELVLIWQPQTEDDIYTEDMYLCGKDYYENNIR